MCRMAFHSNRPRWLDFGSYWLQRDGPVPYQSVFFFEEKPSFFDKPAPNSNLLCHSFSVWVHYLKNHSDRAHRVVNSSPCCMFHTSLSTIQSKKFWNDFHLLGIGYLLCREMGMTSSCLLLLLFFLGLDTIITVIIWQIIVHRYRNKNHTFGEKISSHNYIATSSRSPNFQPLISLDVGLVWYHHHWPQWCHYGHTTTQIQHKSCSTIGWIVR